jgi:hypothetical protein
MNVPISLGLNIEYPAEMTSRPARFDCRRVRRRMGLAPVRLANVVIDQQNKARRYTENTADHRGHGEQRRTGTKNFGRDGAGRPLDSLRFAIGGISSASYFVFMWLPVVSL